MNREVSSTLSAGLPCRQIFRSFPLTYEQTKRVKCCSSYKRVFCPTESIRSPGHNSKQLRREGKTKELTAGETYLCFKHCRYINFFHQVSTCHSWVMEKTWGLARANNVSVESKRQRQASGQSCRPQRFWYFHCFPVSRVTGENRACFTLTWVYFPLYDVQSSSRHGLYSTWHQEIAGC